MQETKPQKIVIIDDEEDGRDSAEWAVEDAGYEPVVIDDDHFSHVDELISKIPPDAGAVLCDQRLRKTGFASFDGSDLLAKLYDLKMPAILNTQHYDDMDVPLRKNRHKIPVLISKDSSLDRSILDAGIETCLAEFHGKFTNERMPYRNVIRVVDFDAKYKEEVLDVIIPGWNPNISVPLPSSIVREWIDNFHPKIGTRLIAKVNSCATKPEDLYFTEFEAAFEPDEIRQFP
jgi:hypothetical protein